ncbi:MAG: sugar phosphate nucleotidyltransferase [Candidatus Odinarchaeota archaeon]
MQAIIMAGGKGRRLRPYTAILPKPLMPIGDIPILEVILRQLKHYGFEQIIFAVGYLAELLQSYFGPGEKWGVKISYSRERKNLGTIGPLSLIKDLEETFLVMNGDVLTDLDYRALFSAHQRAGRLVTIASYKKEVQIDLGVLDMNDQNLLTDYTEKPVLDYQVSMGVYVMNREVQNYIPSDSYFDVPSLMWKLLEENKSPYIYRFTGHWLDIGRKEDYEKAVEEFESNQAMFLPDE